MSSESRQGPGVGGKSKRRWTDPDDDGKSNPPDDLSAQPKRQRVSRACDSCRSKKDKCDGVQPVCSTCASLSRPCTYKANPKKRGLPTGYIRSLELLWGLVFQKIQNSEEVMRALIRSINLPSHLATMGKEAEGSDTLLSSFKNSTVLRDIERILLVLESPEEERERLFQAYRDGDTPLDIDGILASSEALEWQIPEGLEQRETPLAAGMSPSRASMIVSASRPGYRTKECGVQTSTADDFDPSLAIAFNPGDPPMISASSPLQLPYNAWPLLDIYFSYTQCWFPILEKHDILRTAFQYTEGDVFMSRTAPGSGDHAALWAVLTLASLQDASIEPVGGMDGQSNKINPSQLYNTARNLIPSEFGPYEVGHVQALLILSLIKFGQQEWTAAWMLVGHAVRVALILGLDQLSFSGTPLKSPEQEKQVGRAKHVFLGCFVLETLIAEQTSHCPSLRKDDLSRVGLINEDGLEEWHPWEDQTGLRPTQSARTSMQRGPLHALSTFNRLVSLVSILNDLCFLKQDPTVSRSQLESLEVQLQRWASALPRSYRIDLQRRPIRLGSPHIFGLEMIYQSIASVLSLEVAARENDQAIPEMPHRKRAIESAKRLLQLLQTYMETYSFSATVPTFGMMLKYCLPRFSPRDAVSDIELGVRNKIQAFSSHLGQLWSMPDRPNSSQNAFQRNMGAAASPMPLHPPDMTTVEDQTVQHLMPASADPRPPAAGHHPANTSHPATSAPFISSPWLRAPTNIEDGSSLLQRPTPSMATVGGTTEASAHPGQLDNDISSGLRQSTSAPPKPHHGSGMLPELAPQFPGGQYSQAYQDPSLSLSHFVDMDGYGQPRRQQRIAPDLDALFDELASLDGAEKADNSSEFMQNLGFVSDSGVPEVYSFSSQIEPFLLAQTQQVPGSQPTGVRRESQPLGVPGMLKR